MLDDSLLRNDAASSAGLFVTEHEKIITCTGENKEEAEIVCDRHPLRSTLRKPVPRQMDNTR
jgi:hypothetical protein